MAPEIDWWETLKIRVSFWKVHSEACQQFDLHNSVSYIPQKNKDTFFSKLHQMHLLLFLLLLFVWLVLWSLKGFFYCWIGGFWHLRTSSFTQRYIFLFKFFAKFFFVCWIDSIISWLIISRAYIWFWGIKTMIFLLGVKKIIKYLNKIIGKVDWQ